MKTLKFLTIFLLSTMTLVSCLVDDTVASDAYDEGPNVLGFLNSSMLATKLADGTTTTLTIVLKASGPNVSEISETITANIEVDPSSSAIEGTHFSLPESTVSFLPSNNMIATIDLVVLSEGIEAPASESLILNLVNSSSSTTITSGRTGSIDISIKYLCFSDIAGTYSNPDLPSGAEGVAELTEVGVGTYTVSSLPYLGWGGTTPIWFEIVDECGELTFTNCELTESGYFTEGEVVNNGDGSFTLTYIVYNGGDPSTGIFFDFLDAPSTYTPL